MEITIPFSRRVPIKHAVDVFVAGGGPAGIAAAVAAARQGATVLLVEARHSFGGMSTTGMLPVFCTFSDGEHFLADGVGRMVFERCRERHALAPGYDPEQAMTGGPVPFRSEGLKRVYDELLVDNSVAFLLGVRFVDIMMAGVRAENVVLLGADGLFAVSANVFVDCTGNADVAERAGCPYQVGDENGRTQPGTLCSLWAGIDWDESEEKGGITENQQQFLADAISDHMFSEPDPHLPGIWRTGHTLGSGDVGHAFGLNGLDDVSVTRALIRERLKLVEYEHFYRERMPGFQHAELAWSAPCLGLRETRRLQGVYTLSLNDFERRASFPDEIGRYNHEVDLHAPTPEPEDYRKHHEMARTYRCAPGESYGIPYRCLCPPEVENVLVAGRCVSADRYVLGSIRVTPGCFITGQAAGVAAAMAADRHRCVRMVDTDELRTRLRDLGAYIPGA